jgi:hypothetical protein
MRGKGLVSFFFMMAPDFLAPFFQKPFFSLMHVLRSSVRNKLTVNAWLNFKVFVLFHSLYSVFMTIPCYFDYCTFVLHFEVR